MNGMYLGHSFRLEYLHFGTGDLEKTEMNKRTVDSKPRQSKYGVCCNASNATSTEPESVRRTVMACTKGTPVDQRLYIGTGGLVDVILTSNFDFVILTRKYRSAL